MTTTTQTQKPARPTRKQLIEQNANPVSRLAGTQKTFNIAVQFHSDILFGFMQTKQATMLAGYERMAALKRMLSREPKLMAQVDSWLDTNKAIVIAQIAELTKQREAILDGKMMAELQINVPETYETTFEASHPVVHKMIEIIELVDEQLNLSEQVFFAGLMDDISYAKLRNDAIVAIRGSVDRIFKVTSPGNRTGGRFNAKNLADWMREGNKLAFTDFPQIATEIVQKHREAA